MKNRIVKAMMISVTMMMMVTGCEDTAKSNDVKSIETSVELPQNMTDDFQPEIYYIDSQEESDKCYEALQRRKGKIREDMTQAQLAQKLGLTKSVISAYETGLRLPSYDVLIHVSKIFKVSTDYLLGVESQHDLDLSGISDDEVAALKNLIKAMRNRH